MDKILIKGNADLYGSINTPGAKNAALPILVSSLLSDQELVLTNLPNLHDTISMINLLKKFGVKINHKSNIVTLKSNNINKNIVDYDLVRKMRASILVLGPLLSRFNEVKISLPGGCAIGTRPIDLHLQGLSKFGINFEIDSGFVIGKVKKMLTGANIQLPFPSVGATENIMMTATKAKGITYINNAALEPEISDLANCLNKMGAKISGQGSKKIKVIGVDKFKKTNYKIISDRIVAGTFIIAALMLNKKFVIKNINPNFLTYPIKILKKMGAKIEHGKNYVKVFPSGKLKGINIETSPYPGFPTDLQAQIMALMSISKGKSKIKENIFENRFMHISELNRLGANIKISNDLAIIEGSSILRGAPVMASDLRASVSLVLAGLCAEGETILNRVYHLDRGYEKIEETLGKCGPKIIRIK